MSIMASTGSNVANGDGVGIANDEPFDLLSKLKKRLGLTRAQREKTVGKISQLNDELQRLFKQVPKRPKESVSELDERIQALEFKRTTTSMELGDEKIILKEISTVQKIKAQLEEYHSYERSIQNTKSQLSDLKEALKTTNAAIDELENALSKVTLAQKLGCKPAELTKHTVEIPKEKVGRVIGKNGATISSIERAAKVSMDIDSMSGKIHLTGPANAIQEAMAHIDKVTMAVDEDVQLLPQKLTYITSKSALLEFRELHPDVQIDPYREKGRVALRGLPEAVNRCKSDLEKLHLETDTRTLVGREAGILLGPKGSTVNALCENHSVMIDVNETGEDVFTATITGPSVSACVEEIDQLLAANKEVSIRIPVNSIVRNSFLQDSGGPIKRLQKEINSDDRILGIIQLSFSKSGEQNDQNILVVKGRAASVDVAKRIVDQTIAKIHQSLVTLQVDPYVIPKVIGKGGEVIKKLKGGKAVNIEVDKQSGRIVLQSAEEGELDRVRGEIETILDENQVLRIPLEAQVAKTIFRELIRSEHKETINGMVWMSLDDDKGHIVLRGSKEKVEEARTIVEAFIQENFVQEIEISAEDEPVLLTGGEDSVINKMQQEMCVSLNMIRSRLVVVIKGEKGLVEEASKRLYQFLHGGDGHTVRRVAVTEQALGVVIGRAGAKRAELEKKHQGVNIFIHRSNRIIIRGPTDVVEACRVEILRLVSTVKILQVMPITSEQHLLLSNQDVIKRATNGIPVAVTLTHDGVKIKGIYADVRDAQAMLREALTGVYEARVELDATQVACVRGACRDPAHLEQIQSSTNAEVVLDLGANSIVVTGKRSDVRKAKALVVEFLDLLLPDDFVRLKISKPLHSTVGEASALADIAATSGASIILDRDLSCIQIQSPDAAKVLKAKEILIGKIEAAQKRAFVLSFEPQESWLISLIIGKGGNRVNSLRMDTGCNIDVNKAERTVTVTGEDEESVAKAKEQLHKMVDEAQRECAFIELPKQSVAAFLGRGGTKIKIFAAQHGVEVERLRKEPRKLKITGQEQNVLRAKVSLMTWIAQWEQQETGQTITIEKSSIPAVLGKNGSVVAGLQKEFGCKVDINRENLTLAVRGGTQQLREKAVEKIQQIIAEDRAAHAALQGERRNRGAPRTNGEVGHGNGNSNGNGQPAAGIDTTESLDNRKDRTSDFAARPVGLTIVEKDASKAKKKRNRNRSNRPRDISDDSTLQVGTTAGRRLFNLLAESHVSSDQSHPSEAVKEDEQWDSSTVSSAAMDSSGSGGSAGVHNKPYIKSASGFTVRV